MCSHIMCISALDGCAKFQTNRRKIVLIRLILEIAFDPSGENSWSMVHHTTFVKQYYKIPAQKPFIVTECTSVDFH